MGKSPGKWIKTLLLGKKSSKSNAVKGKEKNSNQKETLVAARASEADVPPIPPVISHPTPITTEGNERRLEIENKEATNVQNDGGMSLQQETYSRGSTPEDVPSDPEKERKEKAAIMAQAAFRGYLARRAFKALKGIIRLQALIRGHLVRRQAVSTLCCVLGIVKLQALARGGIVRNSDVGQEVNKKCSLVKLQDGKRTDVEGVNIFIQEAKLSGNPFVRKLVSSSPTVMSLRLYYDPEEPNSIPNWLERWSSSRFWKPVPQPKKIPHSKAQKKLGNGHIVEAESGRPKRSVRRVPAANVDHASVHVASEIEKPKRTFRKVSTHQADTVQENPANEFEKVKRNLRKVHNPVLEHPVQTEVEAEKPKSSLEKVSGLSADHALGQNTGNSAEKVKKETTATAPKASTAVKNEPTHSKSPNVSTAVKNEPTATQSKSPNVADSEPTLISSKSPDAETIEEALEVSKVAELSLGEQTVVEPKPFVENGKDENTPIRNGDLSQKEDPASNQNSKSGRKSSVLAKQERAENGLQNSPTIPSYMAATESAKAKLRAQGSPRFSQDSVEKTSATRRHSLPSSTHNKISSESPRTQRAVHGSGKGSNKSEKSMLSSRDGNGMQC
ncbi:hypothetical protein Tsubulata_011900 [Turnera subulata]|uniref:DUF4005 domain-containing protein n=1 Tax=Turnera subulata TaxID=218843 RepID=A0A9Q0F502_9ROSI|nr:hypothetical protein Tsubulata_011900 [Turnera subulata]